MVTSPELFQSIFRHSKNFSFDPLTIAAVKNAFQMPDRIIKILGSPVKGLEDVAYPVHSQTNRAMAANLAPGASSPILQMNARAMQRLAIFLQDIEEDGITVNLGRWLKDIFTVATAYGVYGPDCPLETDASLVKGVE